METAERNATQDELDAATEHVLASPKEKSVLQIIVVRPKANERQTLERAELSPSGGIAGDRWSVDHWEHLPDGSPHPQSQVSLMNYRVLELIAGNSAAMPLAGDNLIFDLDLSEENLPAGSRLNIGSQVILELTAVPHTGCGKFQKRYGKAAREFVNGDLGSKHSLRGRMATIVQAGTIAVGDRIEKV